MTISKESRVALNPDYKLRPDVDRVVLITKPPPLANRDRIIRLMKPDEAVILSLLDGDRTLLQVSDIWARLADKPADIAYNTIYNLVSGYFSGELGRNEVLLEGNDIQREKLDIYDPMRFIFHADRVNLTDRRLRTPYMVYFLPTRFCPQNCIYCYARTVQQPESNPISLDRLQTIFAELSSLGVDVIQMSGGEIFAAKNIMNIIELAIESGMTVDLPTKYRLSYEQCAHLRDIGVKIIQFSFDSAIPEIIDHMVGLPNYHEGAFAALRNLQRAGLEVRVNAVLLPNNVKLTGNLMDYLGELGNVFRVALSPYGRSAFRHHDEFFVSDEDLQLVEDEARLRKKRYPHMKVSVGSNGAPDSTNGEERRREWARRAACTANRDGFIILPDGRVTVCEELYDHPSFIIGDLTKQSVIEIWNSEKALALINPDQSAVTDGPCKTCDDFAECHSSKGTCWRDTIKCYGWDKPHWPDPRCPYAPSGKRLR